MKTGLKIFIGFIVFFIFQDLISQQITYSGTVQYRSINTTKASGGGSDKHWNWNVNIDEKFIIEATFYVTFTGGGVRSTGVDWYQMTSIEEDIHIEKTVNNDLYDEIVSQFCYDGLLRYKRTETPGDSRTRKISVKSKRSDPDKPCIFSGTMVIQSPTREISYTKTPRIRGVYAITLMGEIKTDVTYMSYNELKFPCDPTINKPPSSITKTTKMNFPIAIGVEKGFDGESIFEGTKVIKDEQKTITKKGSSHGMQHGDMDYFYDNNITVSWSLIEWCDALDQVGDKIDEKDLTDHQKNRIKNVITDLKNPKTDANVLLGLYLWKTLSTEEEGQEFIDDKKNWTDLRKYLSKHCEESLDDLVDKIIGADQKIVDNLNMINLWRLQQNLNDGTVVVQDYIADLQTDPNSTYSDYNYKGN